MPKFAEISHIFNQLPKTIVSEKNQNRPTMTYNYLKRSLSVLAAAAFISMPSLAETWTIAGTDYESSLATEEKVADGVTHRLYKLDGASKLEVQVIEVDMTNENVNITTNKARANNRVCDDAISFKTVGAQADELRAEGKEPIVGMNADFFLTTGNISHQISDGRFEKFATLTQKKARPRFYMTSDRQFGMTQYVIRPTVTVYNEANPEGKEIKDTSVAAIGVGINAGSSTFQIFTPAAGRTTGSSNGVECYAELVEGELAINGVARFRLLDTVTDEAHSNCNSPLDEHYVLFGLKGLGENTLSELKAGDCIEFSLNAENLETADMKELIGGSLRLLVDGTVPNLTLQGSDAQTKWEDGNPAGKEPRAGLGYTNDNSKFFMVLVDGRRTGASEGCTMAQFADIIRNVGADNAFNLDGGGSATMYNALENDVYNWPTDGMNWSAGLKGYMRSVPNSIWVVKGKSTGVDSPIVNIEDTNAPAEYYNLQGIRVANPSNGIFIRRQGSKVTKIAVQ